MKPEKFEFPDVRVLEVLSISKSNGHLELAAKTNFEQSNESLKSSTNLAHRRWTGRVQIVPFDPFQQSISKIGDDNARVTPKPPAVQPRVRTQKRSPTHDHGHNSHKTAGPLVAVYQLPLRAPTVFDARIGMTGSTETAKSR